MVTYSYSFNFCVPFDGFNFKREKIVNSCKVEENIRTLAFPTKIAMKFGLFIIFPPESLAKSFSLEEKFQLYGSTF